jgi:hypothetical protein
MSTTGEDSSDHATRREERMHKRGMAAIAVFGVALTLAWVVALVLLADRLLSGLF